MTSLTLIQAGPGKQCQFLCKWLLLCFWSPKGVSIPGMLLNMGQLVSCQQPLYGRAMQFACIRQQKMSFAFKTMKCFCVCIFTMSVCSLYLVPFGNSSNSMASFLLSQPTDITGRPFIFWGRLGVSHGL